MQKQFGGVRIGWLAILALLHVPCTSWGVPRTWTYVSGSSNWLEAVNWGGTVPGALDDVVINGATVELTNDTAVLNSLLLTNSAKLYVYSPPTNGTTAWGLHVSVTGQISILSSSWIYPYSHPTNGGSVWVACSNLAVDVTSGFDANYKGYRGGVAAFDGHQPRGKGPGGTLGTDYATGGGGYGGAGGRDGGSGGSLSGSTYGDYMNPTDPGSGSGGAGSHTPGQPGGGLVRVEASDSVLMDGNMLANGANGVGYPGSGSGGGIYIKCRTFRGSGSFSAVGGIDTYNSLNTRNGGSGGGGRIAVVYDTLAQTAVSPQPTVTFNAGGGYRQVGVSSVGLVRLSQGGAGSLYLSDTQFFDFAKVRGGAILVPGFSALTANTLSLSNNLIAFPAGFSLTITQDVTLTAAGGIQLTNSVASIGRDLIINSDERGSAYFHGGADQQVAVGRDIRVTKGWIDMSFRGATNLALGVPDNFAFHGAQLRIHAHATETSALTVGGDLTAVSNTLVYLYGGATNGSVGYSLLVDVAGDMTITSNSWVYPYSHYTNGGSVYLRSANMTVGGSGGIDASAMGFAGGIFGLQGSRGFGPGAPASAEGGNNPGGGYGGQGGRTAASTGGPTYGSSNAPVDPGSGGAGTIWGSYAPGGYGGGLIHIEAGSTVIVDGSLLANGETRTGYAGGGSGGGIYIHCKHLQGAAGGALRANGGGGTGGQTSGSGGGGGGRIAVWHKSTNNWLGTTLADGGAGKYTNGVSGTIVFYQIPPAGSVIIVR